MNLPPPLHVLFVNRSYWPDAEATGQLLTELCEDLAEHNNVNVIAGQPNQNTNGEQFQKCGWQTRHGVAVRRVWHTQFRKASFVGRALNYLSFLCSAAIAALVASRPDVIVVETDPPLLCFIGAMVQKLRGARLIVYLQDIYPDIAVALGKLPDGRITRWLRNAMFAVYRRADQVVVLSRDMRDLLVQSGVPAERIAYIPNWVDTAKVMPIKQDNPFRSRHELHGRFVVMYSGNLGLCQRLEDIVETARLLRDRTDILFLFIGDGVLKPRLTAQVAEQKLDNVRFLPYQPKEELSQSLIAAQLQLVPVDPKVVSCLAPSKLYGILASGTPVLVVTPRDSELAEMVEELQVGIASPPGDNEQLADTIQRLAFSTELLETWGSRARTVAETYFDRAIATQAFARMLSSVVNGEPITERQPMVSTPELADAFQPEPTAV